MLMLLSSDGRDSRPDGSAVENIFYAGGFAHIEEVFIDR